MKDPFDLMMGAAFLVVALGFTFMMVVFSLSLL